MKTYCKFFILLFAISFNLMAEKKESYLKFMYKIKPATIHMILIDDLEKNPYVSARLIDYYLNHKNTKLALYYAKKAKTRDNPYFLLAEAKLLIDLGRLEESVKNLKNVLYIHHLEEAFYWLEYLQFKRKYDVKDYFKVIEAGISLNPYLLENYQDFFKRYAKLTKSDLKTYFFLFDTYTLSKKEFLDLNLSVFERFYYLEKMMNRHQSTWAKKYYKELLLLFPYYINMDRLLYLFHKESF